MEFGSRSIGSFAASLECRRVLSVGGANGWLHNVFKCCAQSHDQSARIRIRADARVFSSSERPAAAASAEGQSEKLPTADDIAKLSWDPRNLLGEAGAGSSVGMIERRLAIRRAEMAAKAAAGADGAVVPGPRLQRVPDDSVFGIDPAEVTTDAGFCFRGSDTFAEQLATHYVPTDIDNPNVRVLHVDPPVLLLPDFVDCETCEAVIEAARDSGAMEASAIGADTVGSAANAISARRTSSSLLVDRDVQAAHPRLEELSEHIQARVKELLPGLQWGETGTAPKPGQYTFEALQLASYTDSQHFLAHEDGFPTEIAEANGFQRRVTVLLYLNDVDHGGCTRFDYMNVSVQPRRGTAIVFYPSTSDGEHDARTLHTAEDAQDEKWVAQQWVACGIPRKASSLPSSFGQGSFKFGKEGQSPGGSDLASLMGKSGAKWDASADLSVASELTKLQTERVEKAARKAAKKARKGKGGKPSKGFGSK